MVKIAFVAALAGLVANAAAVPHFRPTGNVTAYPSGGPTATPSLLPWKTANWTVPTPTGTGIPALFPYIKAAANVPATESNLDADSFSSLASEITSLASGGGSDSLDSIVSVLESFMGNNTIPTSVSSDTSLSSVLSVVQDVVKIVEAVVSQVGNLGSIFGLKEKRLEAIPVEKRQGLSTLISLGTVLFKIVTSVISLAESAISSDAASTILDDIVSAVKALLSAVSGLGLGI